MAKDKDQEQLEEEVDEYLLGMLEEEEVTETTFEDDFVLRHRIEQDEVMFNYDADFILITTLKDSRRLVARGIPSSDGILLYDPMEYNMSEANEPAFIPYDSDANTRTVYIHWDDVNRVNEAKPKLADPYRALFPLNESPISIAVFHRIMNEKQNAPTSVLVH